MAEAATKLPVRNEENKTERPTEWRPFESLRREVEHLFDDFQLGSWRSPFGRTILEPFRRGEMGWKTPPSTLSKRRRRTRSRRSCRGWTKATSTSNSPTAP